MAGPLLEQTCDPAQCDRVSITPQIVVLALAALALFLVTLVLVALAVQRIRNIPRSSYCPWPILCERGHGSFARRLIAVARRAIRVSKRKRRTGCRQSGADVKPVAPLRPRPPAPEGENDASVPIRPLIPTAAQRVSPI